MKKIKIALLVLVLFGGVIYFTSKPAKTKLKSYYSGDAINYEQDLIVASTDSESLEIFKLENGGLKRKMYWRPFDTRFNKDDSFYGVKLNIENGRLYAYAISGFTLYKYDISDLETYILVKEVKNTYWEWYNRVDKFGDNIVTISAKGVKVWSKDLETIDSYDIKNDTSYNISSAGNQNLIFNLKEDSNEIEIFDKNERKVSKKLQLNFYGDKNNRGIYYDSYDDYIYFADDLSVKKVTLNGALKGTFEHSGFPGYDVSSSGNEYLYFSNGLGIVKIRKSDMSVISSLRTGGVVAPEGWAMGLKVVATYDGERAVVFNNSSILVLGSNLEVLGHFEAGLDDKVYAKEDLYLSLSSPSINSGTQFELSGGGFFPNEELTVDFYNQKIKVKADNDGRFSKVLNGPSLENSSSRDKVVTQSVKNGFDVRDISERTDVKVSGGQSKLTYSTSLEIRETVLK
ncbi:hypothetical protein CVU82_02235 [Candidatus Falkowbacteria bacterium HGW-Falkowbacteria-1]|jgi:hypothetical protein|uniref:Uncharacterized protein n=1 Tax=Candidatus Falkowbacteria bacterium HGW-Falkowbacteria-1 TaxID=2013768 RepID=A0A2N2E9H3_9BACT|nr:MAG: hypothetical protein CVU82_02235 [Candidatus Falkowbacteria bacterium HGW-Falkowbacteria-1]